MLKRLSIPIVAICLFGCSKVINTELETSHTNTEKYFKYSLANSNMDAIIAHVKKANDSLGFIEKFVANVGRFEWEKNQVLSMGIKERVYAVPILSIKANRVSGILIGVVDQNSNARVTIFRRDKKELFKLWPKNVIITLDQFNSLLDYFEGQLTRNNTFLFDSSHEGYSQIPNKAPFTAFYKVKPSTNTKNTTLGMTCFFVDQVYDVYYCPNGNGADGHNCGQDIYQYSYTSYNTFCTYTDNAYLPPADWGSLGSGGGGVTFVTNYYDFATPPFIWSFNGDDGTTFTDAYPLEEPDFQFDAADNIEVLYPRFTSMVKNLKTFVKNNPKVLDALQKYSGFSKQEILNHLTFGQGPTIKVEEMSGRFGYYSKSNGINTLHMRASYLRGLEQAFLQSTQEGTAFLLAVTILHEYIHLGTARNNISEGRYDFGYGFELDAFNVIVDDDNAGTVVIKFSKYF
jgi:hypothetical protein